MSEPGGVRGGRRGDARGTRLRGSEVGVRLGEGLGVEGCGGETPKRERCVERKLVVSGRRGGDEILGVGGWFSLLLDVEIRRSSFVGLEEVPEELWGRSVDGIVEGLGFGWCVVFGVEVMIGEFRLFGCSGLDG